MRQCACALKCGVLARAKYARRSTISRGTAAVGLWGSDCPRPALLNHQPTSLLSSPNTCRPPSTPPAPPPPPGVHPGRHKNLVMPCPSGHHQSIHFIVFHRGVPQPPQTSLSTTSSRCKLRLVVMILSIVYIMVRWKKVYCTSLLPENIEVTPPLPMHPTSAQLRWSIGPEDLYT